MPWSQSELALGHPDFTTPFKPSWLYDTSLITHPTIVSSNNFLCSLLTGDLTSEFCPLLQWPLRLLCVHVALINLFPPTLPWGPLLHVHYLHIYMDMLNPCTCHVHVLTTEFAHNVHLLYIVTYVHVGCTCTCMYLTSESVQFIHGYTSTCACKHVYV